MKIGFIGCGNMGGALAKAISTDLTTEVYIYDINKEKADEFAKSIGGKSVSEGELISLCDYIFLGVKPNVILSLLSRIASDIRNDTVLISMAAGMKIASLESALGVKLPIIRIMPNTPVMLGEGMTAWCKNALVSDKASAEFESFMASTGVIDLVDEEKIDAFCAIAGCGPAYAYMFIDALAKEGERCGLSKDKAILYASKMLRGAALMATEAGEDPVKLRQNVCSPGGATIEGVRVLEAKDFDSIVGSAIAAAFKRTKELGNG